VEDGRAEPLPDYVHEIRLAQYIGVPVWELEHIPTYVLDQYRVIRSAEIEARKMTSERG